MTKLETELTALGIELPDKSRGAWQMHLRLMQLPGLAKQGELEAAQIKLKHVDPAFRREG